MSKTRLRALIFMALCCDLGIFTKKIIAPAANVITDFLHIPGGIGTSFSIMFVVIAASMLPFGAGTLMGAVQSGIALCMGSVGSMGILSPVGYIVPGLVIDCVFFAARKLGPQGRESLIAANALASVSACISANLIVFRLPLLPLALYASVSLFSGTICGVLAGTLSERLRPIIGGEVKDNEKKHESGYIAYCSAGSSSGCGTPDEQAG